MQRHSKISRISYNTCMKWNSLSVLLIELDNLKQLIFFTNQLTAQPGNKRIQQKEVVDR